MVEIYKPTARLTRYQYGVMHHRRLRRIVVRLIPNDVIEFHEQRSRKRFTLNVDNAFRLAVRISVEAARRAKKEKGGVA